MIVSYKTSDSLFKTQKFILTKYAARFTIADSLAPHTTVIDNTSRNNRIINFINI